jgi:hypothetical protein
VFQRAEGIEHLGLHQETPRNDQAVARGSACGAFIKMSKEIEGGNMASFRSGQKKLQGSLPALHSSSAVWYAMAAR